MATFTKARWEAVAPYLDEALDVPADRREQWLETVCASSPSIAADLRLLLSEHEALDSSSFLQSPIDARDHFRVDHAGTQLGPYRLIKPIGEGGMGAVWLAEQEHPLRRTVALKVVKPGRDSREVLARFESERQALAILNHQNIATVLDAGATSDGRPYFVMEYVAGKPITTFADEHALTVRDRLRVFRQVCDGVEYAHRKAILHRDLKPSNILVSGDASQPVAKIIDFGVAKAIGLEHSGATLQTELGVLVGTPEYMSPEQAGLSSSGIDTRSDLYSLGLVLYELLAGAPPFDSRALRQKTLFDVLRIIRDAEVPRMTTRLKQLPASAAADIAERRGTARGPLLRRLRGDLDWIIARATAKAPDERYASVSEFRADIDRYLRGEPVLAGAPSTWYRVVKLARRHRAATTAFVLILTAITASAIVSGLALVRARRAEENTRRQLVGSMVAQGMARVDEGDSLRGLVYLTRALELESDPAQIRSHRIRIGETLQRSPRLVRLWRHAAAVSAMDVAVAPGIVATGSSDGVLMVRRIPGGQPLVEIRERAPVTDLALSPDGRVLVAGYGDGRIRIFDPSSGKKSQEFEHHERVVDVAVSSNGQFAAAAAGGAIRVWDLTDGRVRIDGTHQGGAHRIEFSDSHALVVTGGEDGIQLWSLSTGAPIESLIPHGPTAVVIDMAFSDDGRWLATAGADSTARLWDVPSMRPVGQPMTHEGYGMVTGVRFVAGSSFLLTTSIDGATRVWQVPETVLAGPPLPSDAVAVRPDVSADLIVASATQGGYVDLWSIADRTRGARQNARVVSRLPQGALATVRFDATGRFLVSAGNDGLVRVWDIAPSLTAPPAFEIDSEDFSWRAIASRDGSSLAVANGATPTRGAYRLFDAGTGRPMTPAMRLGGLSVGLALSPDMRTIATASNDGGIRLWDARSGEPTTPLFQDERPWFTTVFSPDGTLFAVATADDRDAAVRVRRTADGGSVADVISPGGPIRQVEFSSDSRKLLIASGVVNANIKVWDVRSNRLLWTGTHPDGASAAAWSPDGRIAFTGGGDQQVRIWDGESGAAGPVVVKMRGLPTRFGITGDGKRLLAGTDGGHVALADLTRHGDLLATMGQKGFVYEARFSADGLLALTSGGDGSARLWDGTTGEPLTPALRSNSMSRGATFLADGQAWAWTGLGVFIDQLSIENAPVEQLRDLVEAAAARTLNASGSELPLTGDQVEARFVRTPDARRGISDLSGEFSIWRARSAWRRGLFADVASSLETASTFRTLRWPDLMRLVTSYAATRRWSDALGELQKHHSEWTAAPELLYMEAIALSRAVSANAVSAHCSRALEVTRQTTHPERAYWAARACIVASAIDTADRAELERRIELSYPRFEGNLGRDELKAALYWKTGRTDQAATLLIASQDNAPLSQLGLLVRAAIALANGRRADAARLRQRADSAALPAARAYLRPWVEAEAQAWREQIDAHHLVR